MAYTLAQLNARAADIQAADIFPSGHWRYIAAWRLLWRACLISYLAYNFFVWFVLNPGLVLSVLLLLYIYRRLPATNRVRVYGSRVKDKYDLAISLAFIWLNRNATTYSWLMYHTFGYPKAFEQDYFEAWRARLQSRGSVTEVFGFLGQESLPIPVLFDVNDNAVGNDRETLEMLRMCFCWLQDKRGFTELLLPRTLMRIDRVNILSGTTNAMGSRINTLNLGRGENNNVADLERPDRLPADQRSLTEEILEDPAAIGVEFVRVWDSAAVTVISLSPFVGSMLFVALWMGLFIGRYGKDVQTVTQTAFTGAAYIVTAGALFIALFAFLDTQSNRGR